MVSRLRYLYSYFWGQRVKRLRSPLNGMVEVWYISGKYQLDAGNSNYSFGSLHRLFQRVFRETRLAESRPARMLLLGLGAGSVVSILRDELRLTTHVTGIDHDPQIIDLARKYFGIDRYSGLDILCRDAFEYVSATDQQFDVIVVDLFRDQEVPAKFRTGIFLEQCIRILSDNGLLIFNHIVMNKNQQQQFDHLTSLFRSLTGRLNILEIFGTNKVLVLKYMKDPSS
ncbi:MAG TPA: fused MFS/spermidine synthase [Bacteroidales bacterium]|nr:fused MFS/spermidine synthase [Bacteroidales bacterium]